MYYYILESPSSKAVRQNYQRLRDTLTHLGIAGEIVAASPARSPIELAQMGVAKGYSTIVAVGGDQHINQIATAIIGRAVLGIIPIEASPLVTKIIGVHDLRTAAEALKFRRLSIQSTVVIEPETTIFLDAEINSPNLAKISLVLDNRARVNAYFNKLTINRFLELTLESTHMAEERKILGLFRVGGHPVKSESSFHARSARLITDPILPITVSGKPIAKVPVQMRLVSGSLKVITRRGTVLG